MRCLSRHVARGMATTIVAAGLASPGLGVARTSQPGDPPPPPGFALTIRVSGELLDKRASVTVRGISGPARGYSRALAVAGKRTLARLPQGRYRIRAGLIMSGQRTSAASAPVQRVTAGPAGSSVVRFHYPPPPRLPRNFSGRGRYIVRDLGVDVPFTWQGEDGNSRMIAGGAGFPIHFTNVIHDGTLYTQTLKWPGVTRHECDTIGPLDRAVFNEWFESARYVGPVVLEGQRQRRVNHFRVGFVLPPDLPPGAQPRLPVASADIFVDRRDSGTFWSVQHFGIQNLFDPQLDEWIQMTTFTRKPGAVTLPPGCRTGGRQGGETGGR